MKMSSMLMKLDHQNLTNRKKSLTMIMKNLSVPNDMMVKDIRVPMTPNEVIVEKFWKNCFFLT